jgi:hypothetical protein
MNKKVIAITVVALVLVGGIGYLAFGGNKEHSKFPENTKGDSSVKVETSTNAPKLEVASSALLQPLKNLKINMPEYEVVGGIQLKDGKGTFPVGDTGTIGTLTLGNVAIEKTIGGNKRFIVASFNVAIGGKSYQYVGVFQDAAIGFIHKSVEFLGEGVEVRNIVAADVSASDFAVVANVVMGGATKQIILSVEDGVINPAKTIAL